LQVGAPVITVKLNDIVSNLQQPFGGFGNRGGFFSDRAGGLGLAFRSLGFGWRLWIKKVTNVIHGIQGGNRGNDQDASDYHYA